MGGWIKLHRKIITSNMYQSLNSVQRDVMIQCLILANHEPNKWEWKGKIFTCQPGQFVTSLDSLRKHCATGTTTKMVRTALLKLEKWEFLANEGAKTGRVITVINWHTYQAKEIEEGKEQGRIGAGRGQDRGRIGAANKNDKEVKKLKKKDIYKGFPDLNIEAWSKWLSYKKQIKKSYKTENGEKKKVTELLNLSNNNQDLQAKIVQQSIDEEYQGLFPLKNNGKGKQQSKHTGLDEVDYSEGVGEDGRIL